MILLTDGDGSCNDFYLTQAKQNLITIYTIGLGSAVNSALLNEIASETGGKFHQVDNASELPEVFRRISDDTGGDEGVLSDSDEDGLNDCVEVQGAYNPGTGLRYISDPFDADTDGDGLADGQEVEVEDLGDDPHRGRELELGLREDIAHEHSHTVDRLAKDLEALDGIAGVLREDREVLLVATPTWTTTQLEHWATDYLNGKLP